MTATNSTRPDFLCFSKKLMSFYIFFPALLRRATAWKALKQFNKAMKDLNKVLEKEPKNKRAQVSISQSPQTNKNLRELFLSPGFSIRSDTHQLLQPQGLARVLKLWIKKLQIFIIMTWKKT